MRGWRIKFIFLLIVYFAGFATAIYTLAPAPDDEIRISSKKNSVHSAFNSDKFVTSLNTGIHKCIDFGKDAACSTAKYIQQKIEERQLQTDS